MRVIDIRITYLFRHHQRGVLPELVVLLHEVPQVPAGQPHLEVVLLDVLEGGACEQLGQAPALEDVGNAGGVEVQN